MKLRLIFLIAVITLSAVNVLAQKRVENAIKATAIIPSVGNEPCKLNTKPCAVINKATDRPITVRVEESIIVNNSFYKKTIELSKIAPGESRYIGCAGSTKDGQYDKSVGYKILLAYYEEPDSVNVRALYSEKDSE